MPEMLHSVEIAGTSVSLDRDEGLKNVNLAFLKFALLANMNIVKLKNKIKFKKKGPWWFTQKSLMTH